MKEAGEDVPERLSVAGATDLERRLLSAAAHELPSPELSKRMALTIGLSPAPLAGSTDGAGAGDAASVAGSNAAAGAGSTSVLPWISVAVLGLAVAGVVVGTQLWKGSSRQETPVPPTATAATVSASRPAATLPLAAAEPQPSAPASRGRPAVTRNDLREQIVIIDDARAAIAADASQRALHILRRYQEKYPSGSFRPEAAALKIEALVKLGRTDEARVLAERFLTEHGGSLLADRVARLAGIAHP